MKSLYKYSLFLSISLLAKSGIAADTSLISDTPAETTKSAKLINVQTTAPAAPNRGEPGYLGTYDEMVQDLKRVYSLAAETADKVSTEPTVGIPVIAIENWTAVYVAALYRLHPEYRNTFKSMLAETLEASAAIKAGQQPTNEQSTAARAIRELAGNSPTEMTRFMKLLVDANYMIVKEDELSKAGSKGRD